MEEKQKLCEEVRKKKGDVSCTQVVRWKDQEARLVVTQGRRCKLWLSGNDTGSGGVGILVKVEMSGNIVEITRKSS